MVLYFVLTIVGAIFALIPNWIRKTHESIKRERRMTARAKKRISEEYRIQGIVTMACISSVTRAKKRISEEYRIQGIVTIVLAQLLLVLNFFGLDSFYFQNFFYNTWGVSYNFDDINVWVWLGLVLFLITILELFFPIIFLKRIFGKELKNHSKKQLKIEKRFYMSQALVSFIGSLMCFILGYIFF